ncbi:hypothetical protein HMPREF1497_1571 [Fusobacterium sp. CM21]|uniref:hypothetical protein n=1 Tax=Fusobacterium nucleatum TaxID=851 RepID=UPI0003E2919B|nr:hypothetical protein [Fusobacterium nucleatum]ETT13571.1 hypothetical protein HMPREF1497_1571 [Fusobacterium sp. CM21]OHU82012.1 hypothetical protein BKN39_06700 [Fusobacterium nucleatum]
MKIQGFHGYNCYSSVVGEICKRDKNCSVLNLINTQISFFFDKSLFWNNQWFAGSMLNPIDKLLDFDLKYFLGIEKKEFKNKFNNICELSNSINNKIYQFALVDFFYLDSVDWKVLKKFNILPEHDPHYIILDKIIEGNIYYSDPYYDYMGKIDFKKFSNCIESMTKQGYIDNQYFYLNYDIDTKVTNIDIREFIKYRFKRYLRLNMPYNIEQMGVEIDKRRLINGIETKKNWVLNAYNCLRSIEDQYTNLSNISKLNDINYQKSFEELSGLWGMIRKKLIEYYYGRNFNLNDISYSIIKIAYKEKALAKKIIDFM